MAEYLSASRRENATIDDYRSGFPIIPARSTTESEPQFIIPTGSSDTIRTYLAYSGTVSSCDLTLWEHIDGTWYAGPTVADALALSDEFRDWDVEPHTFCGFTVSTIAGGGTVAVRARGIK